jgi:hypothetical protein
MPALPACIDAGGRAPALFNAQAVGAIPTLRGSDRDCGGRRKPIGSNIPKPTCPTCAQEHEARCGTAKAMKDRDSGGCTRAPGRPRMPGPTGGGPSRCRLDED